MKFSSPKLFPLSNLLGCSPVLDRQGVLMRWENFVKRKVSWSDILHADANRLKSLCSQFMMYYRVLGIYILKGRVENHRVHWHIMNAYPSALGEGRYRWILHQVLRTVAERVDAAIRANNYKPEATPIYFVKAGECPHPRRENQLLPTIYRSRLAVESRYWWTFEGSRADRSNSTATGFNSLVNRNKAGAADRTDSPVGGKNRCGLRKKARKISGASRAMYI